MSGREFWEEEPEEERRLFGKHALRLSLIFFGLCALVVFTFWWAGSAVRFSASRLDASTPPTYRVHGQVKDAQTGAPVPWAAVYDDPAGHPPHFATTAGRDGVYELMTLAEPHGVVFNALGYRAKRVKVGKVWYQWMPSGSERVDVLLEREGPRD